jgi:hypothetical protein
VLLFITFENKITYNVITILYQINESFETPGIISSATHCIATVIFMHWIEVTELEISYGLRSVVADVGICYTHNWYMITVQLGPHAICRYQTKFNWKLFLLSPFFIPRHPSFLIFRTFISFRTSVWCLMVAALVKQDVLPSTFIPENFFSLT